MFRNDKKHNRRQGNGVEKKSFRDRIRDTVSRIAKKQCYVVEQSNEPKGEDKYIVVYKCETERGCNYQRVFKGTFKKCHQLKDELNSVERRTIYE